MAPARKRKLPVVPQAARAAAVSAKATQATIATYHTLLKRRAVLQKQAAGEGASTAAGPAASAAARASAELAKVTAQLDELGGIEGYQHASTLGQSRQRGGDSSKVLVEWLKELRDGESEAGRIRMLEIGALLPDNYAAHKWVDNHPIDLNSRHPAILEQDFLQRPVPQGDDDKFDVVSCSLVLNFVPDAADRGRMLQLCRAQLRPSPASLLFLVLPLPCVANSRYTTAESFNALVADVGFELVRERRKPGGKVAYWLWRWSPDVAADTRRWRRKTLRNEGKSRNNFTVLLDGAGI